jgi:hypothetical protein
VGCAVEVLVGGEEAEAFLLRRGGLVVGVDLGFGGGLPWLA